MLHGLHARLPYTFLPVSAFKIEFSSRNKPRCQTNQSHCFLLKASAVSLQLHQWQQLPSCSTKSTTSIPSLKVKIQLFFGLSNATGCYVQLTLNGTLKARLVLAMTWKISFDYCCLTFVDCHSQEQRWDKAITKSQLMIINVVTQKFIWQTTAISDIHVQIAAHFFHLTCYNTCAIFKPPLLFKTSFNIKQFYYTIINNITDCITRKLLGR